MIDELLADAEAKMDQAVAHTGGEFATVRTGRANPASAPQGDRRLLRHSDAAAATCRLQRPRCTDACRVARTTVPRSTAIEKAIQAADLGLNPSNDGNIIRLSFPSLTEERRKELIKLVRHLAEEGRIAIRNVRRHTKDALEALEGDVSEDDVRRAEKHLQDLTDEHVKRLDDLVLRKEEELLEV